MYYQFLFLRNAGTKMHVELNKSTHDKILELKSSSKKNSGRIVFTILNSTRKVVSSSLALTNNLNSLSV